MLARRGPPRCPALETSDDAGDCVDIAARDCGAPPTVPPDALHADPAAPAGGDGTLAAPLTTVAEAVARIAPGQVMVLAAGRYAVDDTLPPGVTLQGRCAAQTHLAGPLRVRAGAVEIADVSFLPGDDGHAGLIIEGEAEVGLRRVAIANLSIEGAASVQATRVIFGGVVDADAVRTAPASLRVADSAQVIARQSAAHLGPVELAPGAFLSFEDSDLVEIDVRLSAGALRLCKVTAFGVVAEGTARLDAEQVFAESLTVSDQSIVRWVDGAWASNLLANGGAEVGLPRVVLEAIAAGLEVIAPPESEVVLRRATLSGAHPVGTVAVWSAGRTAARRPCAPPRFITTRAPVWWSLTPRPRSIESGCTTTPSAWSGKASPCRTGRCARQTTPSPLAAARRPASRRRIERAACQIQNLPLILTRTTATLTFSPFLRREAP